MKASSLASLPESRRADFLASLTDQEAAVLLHEWEFWARENQIAPKAIWTYWLLLAGRGFGKTRTGAEWTRGIAEAVPNARIALVAPTSADARDVMVEGESGLLAVSPPWNRPMYEPSKRRVTWENGAQAALYSAEEPERLRGPQHTHAWCDELAAWKYGPDTWNMLMFGLRLGEHPQCVITTTPKPVKLIKDLIHNRDCIVTRGSTYDNVANLAKPFIDQIITRYEGTRIGRQELNAELLEDIPGALWSRGVLDRNRIKAIETENLSRIVIAIDPAATSTDIADESGIVTAGKDKDERGYILEDCSMRGTPDEVVRRAIAAYYEHGADRIVAEVNNGGEWIESVVRSIDKNVPYKAVHASRGKVTRAEPISALYEQNRVSHVGSFPLLEDQMCEFTADFDRRAAGYSPDRMDALVWALTELLVDAKPDFWAF